MASTNRKRDTCSIGENLLGFGATIVWAEPFMSASIGANTGCFGVTMVWAERFFILHICSKIATCWSRAGLARGPITRVIESGKKM